MKQQKNLKFFQNNNLLNDEDVLINFQKDNIISFEFENCVNTIDLEREVFTRQSNNYIFVLDIKENTSYVKLIKNNSEIPIKVCYSVLVKTSDEIVLKYLLDSDAGEIILKIDLRETI